MELRSWQQEAHLAFRNSPKREFSIGAPSGIGKTLFGKYEASEAIRRGEADFALFLTPLSGIRDQWTESKDNIDENVFNLRIRTLANTALFENRIAPEVNALSLNYQQIVAGKDYLRKVFNDRGRIFLVLDELDRLKLDGEYFQALQISIPFPVKTLGLTATPVRSDNNKIPTLNYSFEDGKFIGRPDYSYSIARAVDEGFLRFPKAIFHDGTMEWFSEHEKIIASFTDKLSEKEQRKRLQTALDSKLPYVQKFFIRLDEHIKRRQAMYPQFNCKALIFCRRTDEARALAHVFKGITDESIEIITTLEDDCHEKLKRWKTKPYAKYAFCVGMISRGYNDVHVTDVVVLTTTTYEGWLHQMLGRALRMVEGGPPDAYMFAPRDPRLVAFYDHWKDEMRSYVEEIETIENEISKEVQEELFYQPIMAQIGEQVYLPDKETLDFILDHICGLVRQNNLAELRNYINKLRINEYQFRKTNEEESYEQRIIRKERQIVHSIRKSVHRSITKHDITNGANNGDYYKIATTALAKQVGAEKIKGCNEEQLDNMIAALARKFRRDLENTDPRSWTYDRIV